MNLRDRHGVVLPDPDSMAGEITSFWTESMSSTGKPVEACRAYLSKFFGCKDMAVMVRLLMQDLTPELVAAALDTLNANSSAGFDGIPTAIYKRFTGLFTPHMFSIMRGILADGALNHDWALALFNPIPKARGTVKAEELRPLVLQDTCHKWVAAIIGLQLKDLLTALTPSYQKGFIKGRFIFQHLWEAAGTWSALPNGLFCPIDFRKAFDSVTHDYCIAFFELMGIPPQYIVILIQLFRAPMAPIIHGGVQLESLIHPTSGVRQGCPLSPSIFSLLVCPVAERIKGLSDSVIVLLYADDLLIIFKGFPKFVARLMQLALEELSQFQLHGGLEVNAGKSALMTVGLWSSEDLLLLAPLGLPVKQSYTYLGVVLGNVTPEESYAPALQKALGRAYSMQHWALTLGERVHLLQLWILPLLVFPARVVFPTEQVISSLKTIYSVALNTTSWGLTNEILSLPLGEGGMALPHPKHYLLWQFSTPFIHSVIRPHTFSGMVRQSFFSWAQSLGLVVTLDTLAHFSMGSNVVWNSLPYLGLSARAFTLVRHNLTPEGPPDLSYDTPLWHSCLFTNQHGHSYFCPQLIRCGILTVGQFLEDDSNYDLLAPTWAPVYRDVLSLIACPGDSPPARTVHWGEWTKKTTALTLCYPKHLKNRQETQVWEKLIRSPLPEAEKDTVRVALWRKLPVGDRLRNWKPNGTQCPLDGGLETVEHSLGLCKYLPFVFGTVDKCFPLYEADGKVVSGVREILNDHPGESLLLPAGLLAWSGILANWDLRCQVKFQGSDPGWHRFLSTWILRLSRWQLLPRTPLPTDQLALFLDALIALRDKGVLDYPTLRPQPATPPPTRAEWRREAKHKRKMDCLGSVVRTIANLEGQGYTIVFTDGSSKKFSGVGWVGGFGVYSSSLISCSAPLPPEARQTINAAELAAAVKALQLLPGGKVAICTDSDYVFKGAKGAAKRPKARGWVGSAGAVSNVPLWEALLSELDLPDRLIERVKVPSHVSITGNEEADSLANNGRLANVSNPGSHTPMGRAERVFTTPRSRPSVRKCRTPVHPPSVSPHDTTLSPALQTLGHTHSPVRPRRELFPQTPPQRGGSPQLWEALGLTVMDTPE